jgi:hypothetical protein
MALFDAFLPTKLKKKNHQHWEAMPWDTGCTCMPENIHTHQKVADSLIESMPCAGVASGTAFRGGRVGEF